MPRRVPNALRSFWIVDTATGDRRQITARLRAQTTHTAMWVEEGVWHDVRQLERAAEYFERDIYTQVRAAFGSEWTPGIDMDPRINILHATGLGDDVLGYTSSLDEYPGDAYPLSNEAEMITVNVEVVDVGSSSYSALLARELTRLIQWHQDRNEARWVREGLVELAASMSGSNADRLHKAYLHQTDTSLTAWEDDDSHRGATHLFVTFFHQRFGDEGTYALLSEPANGVRGFEAALEKLDSELTFDGLFADWLAANYLDSITETKEARYTYPGLDLARPTFSAVYDAYPVKTKTSVQQFGADYILLQGKQDLRIQFAGQVQTPLLAAPHVQGQVWWSNRADESLTTLVGRFDLRNVKRATLAYRAWYDIEANFDYATVEISAHDGQQWQTLPAPSGTDANPYGNNPGWGYTGRSDGWIQEEIDISDYVGTEILVRFSYLTDGVIVGDGLLLDDISVPEVRDQDGGESTESNWSAQGFVLTDGLVPQDYTALLISKGEDLTVQRLPLKEDRTAEWTVPLDSGNIEEAMLIISAMAPRTCQPAPYQLSVSP